MLYMVTFTINIPPMLAYIPYMDPMGYTPRNPHSPRGLGVRAMHMSDSGPGMYVGYVGYFWPAPCDVLG